MTIEIEPRPARVIAGFPCVNCPAVFTVQAKIAGTFSAGLILLASQAAAETCHYGAAGTNVTIAPHDDAAAQVIIDNRLAARTLHVCNVTLDGLAVSVRYLPGSGAIPDDFVITAPEGYIAIPAQIRIEDGSSATVLIRPLADLPLG